MRKKFSSLLFVMFFSHAMLFTQIVPYLSDLNYSAKERGFILSSYALFALFGQILFGYLSDRYSSIQRFVYISTFLIMISGVFSYAYQDQNFLFHFLLLSLMAGSTRIAGNLMETWIVSHEEVAQDFSFIRSFGSLSWGLASFVSGKIVMKLGYHYLGWISFIISLLVLYLASITPDSHQHKSARISLKDLAVLCNNSNYFLITVIFFLVFLIYNTDAITITEYIFFLGGNSSDIGSKWFIQALSEIPMLFLGNKLFKRFKTKDLLSLAIFVLGIRFALTSFSDSVSKVILLSLLQALTFPIIIVSQRQLILKESPKYLKASGQMISVSLSTGLSSILSPLLSAFLLSYFELKQVLFLFSIFLIIPFLLLQFYSLEKE